MKKIFKTKTEAQKWARNNLLSGSMTIIHKGNQREIEALGAKWVKSPQWILNYSHNATGLADLANIMFSTGR